MRSGKVLSVLSLTLLVCVAMFVWGCSDDKATQPLPSDDALNYDGVASEANEVVDSAVASFGTTLEIHFLNAPVDTAISVVYSPVDPDSINTEGDWRVIYADDLALAYSLFRIDSIQFLKNGIPQDSAKGSTAMKLRHHFAYEVGDTTSLFRNREANASFDFTGLNTTTATVNGTRDAHVESRVNYRTGTWRRTYDVEMTFANVTIPRGEENWRAGCPSGGTITGTVEVTSQVGTNAATTSSWDFEVTFDNGVATTVITGAEFTRTTERTICTIN